MPLARYVWQQPSWPDFHVDPERAAAPIAAARRAQGELAGRAAGIGLQLTSEATLEAWIDEVRSTAAIEGEALDQAAVRSSVMRHLGHADTGPRQRHVEGLVEVIADAGAAHPMPLDHDRLWRWQAALFPGGTSGIRRIAVGRYRDHADPMQIVSGMPGKETVHYEAPPSHRVPAEMDRFLAWFAATAPGRPGLLLDGVVRAAVAHLWFETIHPFEDGNGRVGRAIVDLALAQDQGRPPRLYSLSRQLLETRAAYYEQLMLAQRGTGDATAWVVWFADQLTQACARTAGLVEAALVKARFWANHAAEPLNVRQRKVLQRLLDDGDGGFLGGLNADKYMKMTGASKATATRDLVAMVQAGLLVSTGQGKATRYHVNVPGWTHAAAGSAAS